MNSTDNSSRGVAQDSQPNLKRQKPSQQKQREKRLKYQARRQQTSHHGGPVKGGR